MGNVPHFVSPTLGATSPSVKGSCHTEIHTEALESRLLMASTNDPLYSSQWALANTAIAEAWNTTRGSAAVVVADVDTGADYTHRDLYDNVWINQAEIPSSVRSTLRDTDGDGQMHDFRFIVDDAAAEYGVLRIIYVDHSGEA